MLFLVCDANIRLFHGIAIITIKQICSYYNSLTKHGVNTKYVLIDQLLLATDDDNLSLGGMAKLPSAKVVYLRW